MAKKSAQGTADRGFIHRVLIVLALVSLFLLAWHLRHLLLMLFGAVVVATVFRALAGRIQRATGCRPGLATAVSIVLIVAIIIGLAALFGAHVASQAQSLGQSLPLAWRSFEARVEEWGLGEPLRQLAESVRQSGSLASFGRAIMSVGNAVAEVFVVLFAGIFLAAQPRFYRTGAIKLVPPAKRALVTEAMDESETALRLWLKGQLIAMLAVGVVTGIGLWLLGVPSAFILGLIAGTLEFIPFAGPILASVPGILLALAISPDLAIWVALLYLAVQQLEGYLLTPMVQQYAVDLPGVVLLFALLAFGTIFGVLGVILAAPLAVVSFVLVKRLYVIEALHTPTPIPGEGKD